MFWIIFLLNGEEHITYNIVLGTRAWNNTLKRDLVEKNIMMSQKEIVESKNKQGTSCF